MVRAGGSEGGYATRKWATGDHRPVALGSRSTQETDAGGMDLPECMDIIDGEFSYTVVDPWLHSYENSIAGTFKDQNRVEGHYSLHFCGNTLSFEPNEGDWEATKQ